MVRSRGRGEPSRGRGRGKSNLPLVVQKIIGKKATANRPPAPKSSDTSEYAPSGEASEGQSMEVQPEPQSNPPQPTWCYQLHNEPTDNSLVDSDMGSKGSEPSLQLLLLHQSMLMMTIIYQMTGEGVTLEWVALRGQGGGRCGRTNLLA